MALTPLNIYYYLLLLTCVLTGSLLVRRGWTLRFKLLMALSWATILAETLAGICFVRHINHMSWYAPWEFLETLTILYILSGEAILPWVKRLRIVLMTVLPLGAVLYYVLTPAFVYMMLFYLFLELLAAGAVLIDILADVSDVPMHSRPMFWLAAGMLFYCSLYIVIFSLGQLLNTLPHDDFMPFGCLANTFMYGGFIACFVTMRRLDRKVLQQ